MLALGLTISILVFLGMLSTIIYLLLSRKDRAAIRANKASKRILERGQDFPVVKDYMDDLIEYHKTHEEVTYDIKCDTE